MNTHIFKTLDKYFASNIWYFCIFCNIWWHPIALWMYKTQPRTAPSRPAVNWLCRPRTDLKVYQRTPRRKIIAIDTKNLWGRSSVSRVYTSTLGSLSAVLPGWVCNKDRERAPRDRWLLSGYLGPRTHRSWPLGLGCLSSESSATTLQLSKSVDSPWKIESTDKHRDRWEASLKITSA